MILLKQILIYSIGMDAQEIHILMHLLTLFPVELPQFYIKELRLLLGELLLRARVRFPIKLQA